jgi:hypothetical protein
MIFMHDDAAAYHLVYGHLIEEPEEPTSVGQPPLSAIQSVYEPETGPQ